ncbi:type 1 glutamine amidotransferase [Austwickia chelonae]|uniref:type 1 glutamine amidotransferase n=1 Tax=Austwickia chelonae TaxID=100225 RepID=UPI000E25F2FF|nr:type 1 glutamine amidotransferase [Austwickia chelonae]
MQSLPVLVIEHEEECPPGRLVTWAGQAHTDLDIRRCHAGDQVPTHLSEHSGYIVLGGAMSAHDDLHYPWLKDTKHLIVQAVAHAIPFLGICLGHQLAALALGGQVSAHPQGPRRGIHPIALTPAAADDPLSQTLHQGTQLLHWNKDTVTDAPEHTVVLAIDDTGQIQIARYRDTAWGVQGHPEADGSVVERWGRDEEQPPVEGLPTPEEVTRAAQHHDHELAADWAPFAARFFALTQDEHRPQRVVFPRTPSTPRRSPAGISRIARH